MANEETAKTAKYKVTSSFVWERKIQKPGDEITLTGRQASPLKHRGKVEDPPAAKTRKTAAEKKAEESKSAENAES